MGAQAFMDLGEAEKLLGKSRWTVQRNVSKYEHKWVPGKRGGKNGKVLLIAVNSLPAAAREKWLAGSGDRRPETEGRDAGNHVTLTEWQRRKADARLAVVTKANAIKGPNRSGRMKQLARLHNISLSTLYLYIKEYRKRGYSGLVPTRSPRNGANSLTTEQMKFVVRHYADNRQPSKTEVYELLELHCDVDLDQEPASRRAVYQFINETIPEPVKLKYRNGKEAYRKKAQPKITRDMSDLDPNEIWCLDHRPFDVLVLPPVFESRKEWLPAQMKHIKPFRPWLTMAVDLRTRRPVGWHVGSKSKANTNSILLAMRHGILRCGIPRQVYTDWGKDYRSKAFMAALHDLAIDARRAEPYAPWSKPVEGWFNIILNRWEHWLPGWTGNRPDHKPEKLIKEVRTFNLMTFSAFIQSFEQFISWHEKEFRSKDGATVMERWGDFLPEFVADERSLDILLRKRENRVVQNDGISLYGFKYYHNDLHMLLSRKVVIYFNPNDLGDIQVYLPQKNGGLEYACAAQRMGNYSMRPTEEQMKEVNKLRKAAKESVDNYARNYGIMTNRERALAEVIRTGKDRIVSQKPEKPGRRLGGRVRVTYKEGDTELRLDPGGRELPEIVKTDRKSRIPAEPGVQRLRVLPTDGYGRRTEAGRRITKGRTEDGKRKMGPASRLVEMPVPQRERSRLVVKTPEFRKREKSRLVTAPVRRIPEIEEEEL